MWTYWIDADVWTYWTRCGCVDGLGVDPLDMWTCGDYTDLSCGSTGHDTMHSCDLSCGSTGHHTGLIYHVDLLDYTDLSCGSTETHHASETCFARHVSPMVEGFAVSESIRTGSKLQKTNLRKSCEMSVRIRTGSAKTAA